MLAQPRTHKNCMWCYPLHQFTLHTNGSVTLMYLNCLKELNSWCSWFGIWHVNKDFQQPRKSCCCWKTIFWEPQLYTNLGHEWGRGNAIPIVVYCHLKSFSKLDIPILVRQFGKLRLGHGKESKYQSLSRRENKKCNCVSWLFSQRCSVGELKMLQFH